MRNIFNNRKIMLNDETIDVFKIDSEYLLIDGVAYKYPNDITSLVESFVAIMNYYRKTDNNIFILSDNFNIFIEHIMNTWESIKSSIIQDISYFAEIEINEIKKIELKNAKFVQNLDI